MRSIFLNDEVLDTEKNIISSIGISSICLMENAGINSADIIAEYAQKINYDKIVFLCGKGNNAGDGFVAARHLIGRVKEIFVALLYEPEELKGDALINYSVLKNLSGIDSLNVKTVYTFNTLKSETATGKILFIDAIFGIGFKGKLEHRIKTITKYVNSLKNRKVIALDSVSGLSPESNPDDLIKADITISMGVKKYNSLFESGKELSGEIYTVNIGIPENEFDKRNSRNIFEYTEDDAKKINLKRNPLSNKYSNGKVFVLAGSVGLSGAAYLSSLSALKNGSGAVILGIPKSLNTVLERKTTEVMTLPLPETHSKGLSLDGWKDIKKKIEWSDVSLIGPGLGRDEETMELVRKIILEIKGKYVIDADGLYAFKKNTEILGNSNSEIIITPHYGEFSTLSGIKPEIFKKELYAIATDFAEENKVVLVLKNSPSVTTDGEKFIINSSGKENLATVGSGDVLSGIIASTFSITGKALESAAYGSYFHGLCGDELYKKSGNSSTIASDLLNAIPITKNLLFDLT